MRIQLPAAPATGAPLSAALDSPQTEVRVRTTGAGTAMGTGAAFSGTYGAVAASEEAADEEDQEVYHGAAVGEPTATVWSSSLNITNTILGSGMLAMPKALASTGLAFGSLLIGLSGLASMFGLTLLTHCAARIGRHSSFFQISKLTYPQAAVWFDLAIAVKCFGVSVSYLVIIGDLMPTVMRSIYPSTPPEYLIFSKFLWITMAMVLLLPVAFAKQLNSLRHTSALALCAVVYLVAIVLGNFVLNRNWENSPNRPKWNEIVWVKVDGSFFRTLPIFVFAFTCHQNIFAVHNELKDNSVSKVAEVIELSLGTAFVVYQTIGISGYLTFGNAVAGNIISMYAPSWIITGGQVALAGLFLLSYPLQCHPARASLEKVLTGGNAAIPMTEFRFNAITSGLLIGSYLISISVDDLSTVLSLVGATGSTAICYILPGLLYYKLRTVTDPMDEQRNWDWMKGGALALAAFGVVVMVLSVATQLAAVLKGGKGSGGH